MLAGVVVLIAAALIAAAVAIYTEQRSFLYGRLDQRVIAAAVPISYELGVDSRIVRRSVSVRDSSHRRTTVPSPKALEAFLPAGTWGELVDSAGNVRRGPVVVSYGDRSLPAPRLPIRLPSSTPGSTPAPVSVGSQGPRHARYRLAAIQLVGNRGTLVIAVPSSEVDDTLDRLVLWEIVVGGGTILLLSALGWVVIRIALRPLAAMGATAGAIADGDLSRRVEPATPRTEVGQLGLSLNKMLVRIEDAFAAREKSERRLRQFLSDASHELRTPLASIRGYTELFRMGATDDPSVVERSMARIGSEAMRMGELVEDLLTLARVDERREAIREQVDLDAVATAAVADARARTPSRTILLGSDGPTIVAGDPRALRRVVDNLLGNAVVHTPDGTSIEVHLVHEGDEAVLRVRDHGPGVPEEAREHVFDRFWRGEAGRSRDTGGTGLGLAIVRELLAAHHGTVRVANAETGGAIFTVRLPLSAACGAAGRPAGQAPAPGSADDDSGPRAGGTGTDGSPDTGAGGTSARRYVGPHATP